MKPCWYSRFQHGFRMICQVDVISTVEVGEKKDRVSDSNVFPCAFNTILILVVLAHNHLIISPFIVTRGEFTWLL